MTTTLTATATILALDTDRYKRVACGCGVRVHRTPFDPDWASKRHLDATLSGSAALLLRLRGQGYLGFLQGTIEGGLRGFCDQEALLLLVPDERLHLITLEADDEIRRLPVLGHADAVARV